MQKNNKIIKFIQSFTDKVETDYSSVTATETLGFLYQLLSSLKKIQISRTTFAKARRPGRPSKQEKSLTYQRPNAKINIFNGLLKRKKQGIEIVGRGSSKKPIDTRLEELKKDLEYYIDNGVVTEDSLGFLVYNTKIYAQLINKKDEGRT